LARSLPNHEKRQAIGRKVGENFDKLAPAQLVVCEPRCELCNTQSRHYGRELSFCIAEYEAMRHRALRDSATLGSKRP